MSQIKSFLVRLKIWNSNLLKRVGDFYKKHPRLKWMSFLAGPPVLFLILIILIVLFEAPSKRRLQKIRNSVASEVYSADSVLLGRYFIEDRTEVSYDEISPVVIEALINTEDNRFYSHNGVDFKALGRVIIKSILMQDESSGGGSTLTQQLAKNLYPRRKYWVFPLLINKLKEIITASRIESIYSKKEIITLYLNTVPFPDNTFGIQAAAKLFYSCNASALNAEQAAVLIGSLKATHSYNPRLFPKRSKERRDVVLSILLRSNVLDSVVVDSIKKTPITLIYNKVSHHEGLAPYFRENLKQDLLKWCTENLKEDGSPYNLYSDGLKIYTTIDSKMQKYAEDGMVRQMKLLQGEFIDHLDGDMPWKNNERILEDAIKRTSRYIGLTENGLSAEEALKELTKPVPMKVFSWEGIKDSLMSPIDSVTHHLKYLNSGFVVMDYSTGEVKAWVGGINHDFYQFDHVNYGTKRQVGSIFKPIVYAQAIEEGMNPCELIPAYQETYIDKEGEKWTPRNMQGDYGVEYSMLGGLAYSVNTVAVKLIQKAGVEKTMEMAKRMGIKSEIPDVPSIALGSSTASLLEMITVYGCVANQGITNYPFYVKQIVDLDGKVFHDFVPTTSGKQAMTPETAQLVRHLLQTVVYEGTASRIRWKYGIYSDVAGKTGTTQANADGWFIGFTPNLVMGSWVGADDPRIRFRNTKLGQGSNTALPIAGYFLESLYKDENYSDLVKARFKSLPASLKEMVNCDLYEIDEEMEVKILEIIHQRDSIRQADTTAVLQDNFLETIYKRKLRIQQAKFKSDSLRLLDSLEIDGG